MKKFKVFINGANFIFGQKNKEKNLREGFYTTRWVEANNSNEAEIMANELIWDELKLKVFNDPSDPPIMHVEEIEELEDFGDHHIPGTGFAFYIEDEDQAKEYFSDLEEE
jgi:hypothetical protein